MPKTTPLPPAAVRNVLVHEMTVFYRNLCRTTPRWPDVSHQVFVESLAKALVQASEDRGVNQVAYLQTLVHELQDQVNILSEKGKQ